MLAAADFDQLRALFRAELAAPAVTDRILTNLEAAVYAKFLTIAEAAAKNARIPQGFYRWARRWRYKSVANNRHAKSQLDTALARETAHSRLQGRCTGRAARRQKLLAA